MTAGEESIRARKLWKEADARKLKGDARISWVLKELNRDLRTDERQLRRILAKTCDGIDCESSNLAGD
jgi:hypothetical protein